MGTVVINNHIKIIDNEVLQVTKKFAENNLSQACLSCNDYKSDKYYEWTMGSTAYAVIFELPKLFNAQAQDIHSLLAFYCHEYCERRGLNSDNFVDIYKKNYNKNIIYKDA